MSRAGNRLMPSAAVENAYYNAVSPMARAMFDVVKRSILRQDFHVKRQSVVSTFEEKADDIARDFVDRVVQYTRGAYRNAARGLKTKEPPDDGISSRAARAAVRRLLRDNGKLIRSIPRVYLDKVESAIFSYNDGNLSQSGFDARMADLERITLGRCRLIARDQNNKATEALFLARMSQNGVMMVKWCHSHLSNTPRDYHLTKWDGHSGKRNGRPNGLNGFVFRIDDPPVIDLKTGERGYPAQLINCKCFLVPVE